MKLHPRVRPSAAFTLIELLATIAIIGVLASLIMVTMGRAREAAQGSRCTANLRKIQLANLTHASQKQGACVPIFVNNDNGSRKYNWYKNPELLRLLGYSDQAVIPAEIACPLATVTIADGTGYGCNSEGMSSGSSTGGYVRVVKQLQLPRPAETLAYADALDWQVYAVGADRYQGAEVSTQHAVAYRHDSRASVVYWDAHTARLTRDQVVGNSRLWLQLQ